MVLRNIRPITDKNVSLSDLIAFQNQYKQKSCTTKASTAAFGFLNDTNVHSHDDDTIDKIVPAPEKMSCIPLELENSTDYQSKFCYAKNHISTKS